MINIGDNTTGIVGSQEKQENLSISPLFQILNHYNIKNRNLDIFNMTLGECKSSLAI